jgi:Cysteine-rich CPCC
MKDAWMEDRFPCPCCGFLTMGEPPGSFAICPVCAWEDDNVQHRDPSYVGGANRISLSQARENYRSFCACSESEISNVRAPLPDEFPVAQA